MKVNKETADKIGVAYFGEVDYALSAFGNVIGRYNHGKRVEGGGDVDHIGPKNPSNPTAPGGSNTFENVQPLEHSVNEQKANNLQGKADGITFAISGVGTHEGKKIGRMSMKIDGEGVGAYDEPNY